MLFEITAEHINKLDDEQLRNLIGLLCESTFRKNNFDAKGVSWSGDQNAADGGIDVKCIKHTGENIDSFIPRNYVGFQVKKYDLTPAKIKQEMQDHGCLKESIKAICENEGAYIIVCSNSSTSDSMYNNRVRAMRNVVQEYKSNCNIVLDFYDSNKIATWVREYPNMILWVRDKIGEPVNGWRGYDKWSDIQKKNNTQFFLDEEKRFYDYSKGEEFTVLEGIQILRERLGHKGNIVRLTGLSGVGKTRLLETIFDDSVGSESLNKDLVVYADMADDVEPIPQQMLSYLIGEEKTYYLVIDNCGIELHKSLLKILRQNTTGKVSVVTVEYDVKERDTEETECFRLQPASNTVINSLLANNFRNYNSWEINRLVDISGGNARLALAFAKALKYQKNINMLTDNDLFNRLFWQKGTENQNLLASAELISLLYSLNYRETGSDSELNKLSEISGQSIQMILSNIYELEKRGLLQKRGKWCAVLPHALSNYLAMEAINSYGSIVEEGIINKGTQRMKYSFAHRLSLLSEERTVKELVNRWLRKDYMDSGNLKMPSPEFPYLARVSPDIALNCIKNNWSGLERMYFRNGPIDDALLDLTYRPELFSESIEYVLQLEIEGKVKTGIEKYFKYNCFMKQKDCDIRKGVIDRWLNSEDKKTQEIGKRCLFATISIRYDVRGESSDFEENTAENKNYWFHIFLPSTANIFIKEFKSDPLTCWRDSYINALRILLTEGLEDEVLSTFKYIRKFLFWPFGYLYFYQLNGSDRSKKINKSGRTVLGDILNVLSPQTDVENAIFWCTLNVYERQALDITAEEYQKNEKLWGERLALCPELYKNAARELVLTSCDISGIGGIFAESNHRKELWKLSCTVLEKNKYNNKCLYLIKGMIQKIENPDEREEYLSYLQKNAKLRRAYIALVISLGIFQQRKEQIHNMLRRGELQFADLDPLWQSNTIGLLSVEEWLDFFNDIDKNKDERFILDLCSTRLKYDKEIKGKVCRNDVISTLKYVMKHNLSLLYVYEDVYAVFCEEFKNISDTDVLTDFYRWIKSDIENNYSREIDVPGILGPMSREAPYLFLDVFVEDVSYYSNVRSVLREREPVAHSILWNIESISLIAWCNQNPDQRYKKVFMCRYGYQKTQQNYVWSDVAIQAMQAANDKKSMAEILMNQIRPIYSHGSFSNEYRKRMSLYDMFLKDDDLEISEMAKAKKEEAVINMNFAKQSEDAYKEEMQRFE